MDLLHRQDLSQPAKLLLLCTLLAKDGIITAKEKVFLKELVLRRDQRLAALLNKFESHSSTNSSFLEAVYSLVEEESRMLFDELFADTGLEVGKALSKRQREALELQEEKSLIYGEVDYPSFYRILRKLHVPAGGVFYDLGSGTGKAVFAARLTQDFALCVGVEVLSQLHSRASMILDRFNASFKRYLCFGASKEVVVVSGSLTELDWSDGSLVFANSTCFDDDLMLAMSRKAESLAPVRASLL